MRNIMTCIECNHKWKTGDLPVFCPNCFHQLFNENAYLIQHVITKIEKPFYKRFSYFAKHLEKHLPEDGYFRSSYKKTINTELILELAFKNKELAEWLMKNDASEFGSQMILTRLYDYMPSPWDLAAPGYHIKIIKVKDITEVMNKIRLSTIYFQTGKEAKKLSFQKK